ncbi:dual specificity protein phosphatase family protein [bacterium]|nr:dual specificity protein phosphatase family protein [bacterium]
MLAKKGITMSKLKKMAGILISLLIIVSGVSCKNNSNIDAISDATTKYVRNEKTILPPKSDTYTTIGSLPGLKGFVVKYDDNFYRGGELYSKEGIQSLKSLNISTILSVAPTEVERKMAKKYGLRLFEVPFTKEVGLSKRDLEKVINILKKENMPLYVHCHGGTHRGGIVGMVYRIYKNNWSLEKALLEYAYLGGSLKDDQKMIQSIKMTPILNESKNR